MFLALDIPPFVMYCVNGKPRSSLFIESTDSMMTIILLLVYTILGTGITLKFENHGEVKLNIHNVV